MMSTFNLPYEPARHASPAAGPGLFTRILRHLIEHRARQADRHIRRYLAHLPDTTPHPIVLTLADIDDVRAGGRDNGKPGIRSVYGPSYYAAFVVDPDSYRIEAYCGAAS